MNGYVSIGHTKKARGFKGALRVALHEPYLEDFFATEVVFLKLNEQLLPFFIKEIVEEGDLVVCFEEVDTKESAQKLTGKELFLAEKDIRSATGQGSSAKLKEEQFIGFTIFDKTYGEVGTIEEIVALPQQAMAIVRYNRKEILIPLSDAFIEEIEKSNRILSMDLPEGLLNL